MSKNKKKDSRQVDQPKRNKPVKPIIEKNGPQIEIHKKEMKGQKNVE